MKTLRFIGMAIIALVMGTSSFSCSNDSTSDFILAKEDQTLNFTAEGGEKTISFKSNNVDWLAIGSSCWVTCNPERGKDGDNTFTISVRQNIGPSRTYILQLNVKGSGLCDITINQEGTDNTLGTYTIEVEAGTLWKFMSNIYREEYIPLVKELTLKGDLNGSDIRILRKMLCNGGDFYGALSVLNLSDANIVEGGDTYIAGLPRYTSNDEIGSQMFTFPEYTTDVLKSIILPNSIKAIGTLAFEKRGNLTTIAIPDNVEIIENGAFDGCAKLTLLEMGSKVEKIGDAFYTNNLEEIHIKTLTPPSIVNITFSQYSYDNATLYVPKGSKEAYQNKHGWKNFKNIVEE